jgi:sugar phosphate isomerase/epimerase
VGPNAAGRRYALTDARRLKDGGVPVVSFGINTCFAVKRWPEAEEWTAIVADLGLEKVQFSFDLLDPQVEGSLARFNGIRAISDRREISVCSASTGFIAYAQNLLGHPDEGVRVRAERWYEAAISGGARLGARALGGHFAAMSASEFADSGRRERSIRRTKEAVLRLSEHAAREGLECLLWEVMPVAREYPARIDEAEELMSDWVDRASVPVRLCLDLGHACLAGRPPLAVHRGVQYKRDHRS